MASSYNTRPRRLPQPGQVLYGADPQAIPGSTLAGAFGITPTLLMSSAAAAAAFFVASKFGAATTTSLSAGAGAFLYVFHYQQLRLPNASGQLARYPNSHLQQVPGGASAYGA